MSWMGEGRGKPYGTSSATAAVTAESVSATASGVAAATGKHPAAAAVMYSPAARPPQVFPKYLRRFFLRRGQQPGG